MTNIPPLVVHAFISAEDKNFFEHHGIDFRGLIGAVFDYGLKTVTGGGRAQGRIDHHPAGREVSAAGLELQCRPQERARRSSPSGSKSTLTKQQILEIYLNSIFLGRNAYGVQAAARAYFDKDVNELTLPEAAYLAVLPKAPSNYDPVRATQKALDRRNYVLREMYRNGYITEDQWKTGRRDAARHDPLRQQREVPAAGRLLHGGGPPRADQAVRRGRRRTGRTASMPAACGCAPR